jgi:hypothetical protein
MASSSSPSITTSNDDNDDDNEDTTNAGGSLLRQTLMAQDEVFVYKVPPLTTSSGYRANDWNLSKPLKEGVGFQVERRNNDLYLLFTLENHTKLFALCKIGDDDNAAAAGGTSTVTTNLHRFVEPVMDSSRYFVCRTTQGPLLGFGFRERDVAIDLLANLQQFQKSIRREMEATQQLSRVTEKFKIADIKDGQQIHINIKGMQKRHTKTKQSSTTGVGGSPFLLKKPPPSADATTITTRTNAATAAATTEEGDEFGDFQEPGATADTEENAEAAWAAADPTATTATSQDDGGQQQQQQQQEEEEETPPEAAATEAAAAVDDTHGDKDDDDDFGDDFGDFHGASS